MGAHGHGSSKVTTCQMTTFDEVFFSNTSPGITHCNVYFQCQELAETVHEQEDPTRNVNWSAKDSDMFSFRLTFSLFAKTHSKQQVAER
jgi:hypothetical protein